MENRSYVNDDNNVTSFSFGGDVAVQKPVQVSVGNFMEIPLTDVKVDDGGRSEKHIEIVVTGDVRRASETRSNVSTAAQAPYPSMSKDDVIKFSNTPFWTTLRIASIIIFWLIWLAFLTTVIVLTIITPRCQPVKEQEWWEKGVFYQIYIRSFYDQNNDGVGDLIGVAEKLPVLKELGVDALVLSSVFQSHESTATNKVDFGYEVTDYGDIDKSLGTRADFEYLVNRTHEHGMKLVIEFVPNHTGKNHKWYDEFSKPDSNKWNSYVSASDKFNNNWTTVYSSKESPWKPELKNNRKYLHQFLESQPELNLRSKFIQEELEKYLKFWTGLKVDGFKIVNSDFLFENSDLKDEDPAGNFTETRGQHESFELIARWRNMLTKNKVAGDQEAPILITDGDSSTHFFYDYYDHNGAPVAHLPIANQLTQIKGNNMGPKFIRTLLEEYNSRRPKDSTPLWNSGDQDKPRLLSAVGSLYSRISLILRLTLPGSSMLYYGEEIDMGDDSTKENLEKDPVHDIDSKLSRYGYRQPMYWSNLTHVGFCNDSCVKSRPWLEINKQADILSNNVETQRADPNSVWSLVRDITALRKKQNSLQYGALHLGSHDNDDEHLFTYIREHEGNDRILIVLNFGGNMTSPIDLTKTKIGCPVPPKASVALVSDRFGPYHVGDDANLKDVKLREGYGFVARWKYVRSIK